MWYYFSLALSAACFVLPRDASELFSFDDHYQPHPSSIGKGRHAISARLGSAILPRRDATMSCHAEAHSFNFNTNARQSDFILVT